MRARKEPGSRTLYRYASAMRLSDRINPGRGTVRGIRLFFIALLAAWTVLWFVQAVQGILADTSLGRGELEGGLAFYQVWELVFVSAVYFVRWLPGAVLLAFPAVVGPAVRLMDRLRSRRALPSS